MGIVFPLGYDEFSRIREENFYYVDKTGFIRELLDRKFQANLITRPRRFGKSLTMSMLEDFFDISRDSRAHFAGLKIAQDSALCGEWMNRWPVIALTLKNVEGRSFAAAYGRLEVLIADLCKKYAFLEHSSHVNGADREQFVRLEYQEAEPQNLQSALLLLTRMMAAHYGRPVILLIDEYDVPLAKAGEEGYYEEMLEMIRALLGTALKTNGFLKFAVITGCLRIAKESIFTGMNNLVTDTISGDRFNEQIGFTQSDVDRILADTGFTDHSEEIRMWYDGFRFGNADVYCPWDVLNHVNALLDNPKKKPQNYWGNTSHNGIIYRFISRTDLQVNDKFETLMSGGRIAERITEELTYDTLHSSEQNLWSLLYQTGYLTTAEPETGDGQFERDQVLLKIPNEEVKSIFRTAIVDWFDDFIKTENRSVLFEALWGGKPETVQKYISDLLFQTISYHDYQESYYHAFLAGLLAGAGYSVESNYEHGTGRPDLVVKDKRHRRALIIETKHARTEAALEAKCQEAIRQIVKENYMQGVSDGYHTRIGYGIAFFEKECRVLKI